ncbi:MAG: phage head-binding domain-containing protein [Proteobacteria bacterium]|nr:phage head-binding domain-containing protein [Pseudomonadota bacterium]
MALNYVELPFDYFPDFNKGKPLFGGKIYVGNVGEDPSIPTNQKPIYVQGPDDSASVEVEQPLDIGAGGVPSYNGVPVVVTVDGDYSILVLDKNDSQEYYYPDVRSGEPLTPGNIGEYTNYSFSSVSNLKSGAIGGEDTTDELKELIDSGDVAASTLGYYGTYSDSETTSGGANYILTTLARVKAEKGAAWVPDTYGDHYLFGGTDYVAIMIINPDMDLRSFGVSTSVVDNSSAITSAGNNPEVKNLTGGVGDVYTFSGEITIEKDCNIYGDFTFKSSNNAQFVISGSIEDKGSLTVGGVKGTNTVSVGTSAGFADEDLIIIHNQVESSFSKHRTAYQDGEYNIIKDISGATLELKNLLVGDYPVASTTKVIKVNPVSVNIKDVKFIDTFGASPQNVLVIQYAKGVNIDGDAVVSGGTTSALFLNKCYSIKIQSGSYTNTAANTGLQYGIAFVNCQGASVGLVTAYGTRHGITTGSDGLTGAVPNRSIIIDNAASISNDPASGVYAADFHGNTVDSGYYRCNIFGDIGLGGENISAEGNTIVANRVNPPIELQEVVGGTYSIKRNKLVLGDSAAFAKVVGFGSATLSENVDRSYVMNIDDLECELQSSCTEIISIFNAAVGEVKTRWKLKNCTITGDTSGLTRIISGSVSNTASHTSAPIRPESVELSSLDYTPHPSSVAFMELTSGSWTGCKVTMPTVTAKSDVTIGSSDWYSTSGGSGDTGTFAFNYPDYPGEPVIYVEHNGFAKVSSPRFFGAIDNLDETQANVFLTTSDSSNTAGAERTLTLTVTASMQAVTLN